MEIDKVCRGLECLIQMTSCVGCPYWDSGRTRKDCLSHIGEDAIAMLKENGAVTVHDPGAYCPKCGWMLYPEDHPHNCGNCGQVVKWE